MKIRNIIIAVLVVALGIFGGISFFGEKPAQPIGGVGYNIYNGITVHGQLTWGDTALATTTTATSDTILGATLLNYGIIDVMSNTGSLSYTLPATTTMMSLLPDVGLSRKWLFHNATSSASITLTIKAPTGMDLVGVSTAADVLAPGDWAELTCSQIYYRTADNENIMCIVTKLLNAD